MSASDLVFALVSTGDTIYNPQLVGGTAVQIQVTNFGTEDLENLGLYIVAATNVGDVDNPADYPPETDYQDLLAWGTASDLGLAAQGGIVIDCPQNSGTFNGYITRDAGSLRENRIDFIDMAAGDSAVFSVTFETPPAVPSRRFYVDLRLE